MTKVARIQAGNGAKARVQAPHIRLDPPVWRSSAQYYAFLSYSHKDEELADWLHSELERFQVPRALAGKLTANGVIPKRLTPIFRDRHELAAATDLGEEIEAALAASQYLLVLCSPDAAKSHWTNAEIETFKRTRPDGCVLAAIVAGDPFASDIEGHEGEECFPPALRQKYDRRGRPTGKRAEPLAADLRETGDGRRMGFLKLVAGMLGVGLDELVQRDATRRQRRLAWLSAASLGGMVVASFLAITAIQARDAARDQRREAEGLVAFMVGDLKDKLEPIGKLEALDGLGSRVLRYYSKQDMSELSDVGLAQRSKALTLMGQIAQARGNPAAALRLYREAYAGTAEALRRDPDDPQRLYEHAQNVFYIGDIARSHGDLPAVESAWREYKRLADRIAMLAPDNLKFRMEALYATENLGIVLYERRRYAESAQMLESTVRPMESMAAIDPNNRDYREAVTNTLSWLAQSQWALGKIDAAIASRQQQSQFLEQLTKRGITDVAFREQLLVARRSLGIMMTFRGQLREAAEELRSAVLEGDRLMEIEPENMTWRKRSAEARFDLVRALLANGDVGEAADQTRTACALAARVRSSGVGASGQQVQTSCLEMQSHLALKAGSTADALALAKQALASARSERAVDWINNRYSIAAQYRLVGDIYQRMGDTGAAIRAWNTGLAQLPSQVAERPLELRERSELLRRLGRTEELRPLSERLAAMGYRNFT